jgi:hypothetical protein
MKDRTGNLLVFGQRAARSERSAVSPHSLVCLRDLLQEWTEQRFSDKVSLALWEQLTAEGEKESEAEREKPARAPTCKFLP